MIKFLTAAAAVALATVPATAANFVVTFPSTQTIPSNNDFQSQLNGLGLFSFASTGATLTIDGPGVVTFEYLGSESGFIDTFTAGPVSGTENNANNFGSPVVLGSTTFLTAGAFNPQFTTSGNALVSTPGMGSFGILTSNTGTGAGGFTSNVVYFGFDDQVNNIDDNHDDFIVRATIGAIPEPTTWAMMIGGFGLVGAGLRRRASVGTAVTA